MNSTLNITKVEIRYVPDNQVAEVTTKAMLGRVDGFLPIEQLEVQDTPGFEHTRRAVDHPKNLETIYRAYQVIDGTDDERCAQLRIRGMSWGDAIVIDVGTKEAPQTVAYYVAAEGFVTRAGDGTLLPVVED